MQTLWKKEMHPPRSCAFRVTAAAPAHTITNTVANTNEVESPGAVILKIVESIRQTNSGPHKSPEELQQLEHEND